MLRENDVYLRTKSIEYAGQRKYHHKGGKSQ